MNKNNLLTIAIPTYNRAHTLEKIINQLKGQSKYKFTILISDDCSPDKGETEKMVKKCQKEMPNLVFHRNRKNLGYSGNVCKLYELSKTRYIWFICDDDTVLPGAVDKILNSLVKYEPVVAIFNFKQLDPFGVEVVGGVPKDVVYTDIAKLTDYQPLQRITFLSILVVEKRLSVDEIKKTNYMDNVFFQITLSLMLLSDKFKFCEIAQTILKRNVGYKYGEFFKFYLVDHLKAVFGINHKFNNDLFIKWSKKHLFTSLKLYLSQKLGLFNYNGKPTKETIRLITKYYGMHSIIIFMFFPIYCIVPTFLVRWVYLLALIKIHGLKNGKVAYRENLNRAYRDERKTEFTSYR
jgi:glycosyltransferase involved in cell wall biosynthesis